MRVARRETAAFVVRERVNVVGWKRPTGKSCGE